MKKPKIRFKGYQEDWEQRKLDDVLERRIEQRQQSEEYPRLAFASGQGVIPLSERKTNNREQLTKDEFTKKYLVTELDDIVYNPANVKYGAIDRNKCGRGLISPIYVTFTTSEISGFIERIVTSHDFQQKALKFEEGTVTKRQSVNPEDFLTIDIWVARQREEQRKISKYFDNLDHLITLHQRKCEETKTLKKYMLQKMFPQNGHSVPEIRFSGFTEDWEQRKFADFTWDAGKRNKEDLDLEPYAITNEHGFIRQRDAHDDFGYMKDTDRKAYNIVQPNSFAYNPARINVGSIGYYKGVENVIVSSLYEVFQTDNYVNDRFLWHWLKSDEFPRWIEKLQEGSVRLYFYYDKLCECQLYMPSLEEQEKIATFLDDLDHLITLHQHKCEELQNIKKFMLKNMFI